MDAPPPDLMRRWNATAPALVARTAIATVWRVRHDGGDAALKLYRRDDMGNEAAGLAYLASRAGHGAARIRASTRNAVLLDWLDGPSLGDLTRAGRDAEAADRLLAMARRLRGGDPDIAGLPGLDTWFADLVAADFAADCPAPARRAITRARAIATGLLATAPPPRPLHGDLHHDNVRLGSDGWRAFDAKGVAGDPGYELANAFRNPKGAGAVHRDPARIDRLADLWAPGLGLERRRLLGWACAKTALSIAWRARGRIGDDPEHDLLAILLDRHDAARPPRTKKGGTDDRSRP